MNRSKLKFSSARQVVDNVPGLHSTFEGEPLDSDPIAFVEHLLQAGKTDKALSFCCFLLSRQDATRWVCAALRAVPGGWTQAEEELLALAEAWVTNPSERSRRAALKAAEDSGFKSAPGWAAAAAGWSGGNMVDTVEIMVPPPAHLTGQAVRHGFTLAALKLGRQDWTAFDRQSVAAALQLLEV